MEFFLEGRQVVWNLARDLLQEGKGVRLQVFGSSMYPTIRSGDFIWLEPLPAAPLEVGTILLFQDAAGRFVIHRLVALQEEGGGTLLVARGDGYGDRVDEVSPSKVLGCVSHVEREGNKRVLTLKGPSRWERGLAFLYYWGLRLKSRVTKERCLSLRLRT